MQTPSLAPGAIFGLFAVSVATRLRWNLKQLLEAAVLGQFVVRQVRGVAGLGLSSHSPTLWPSLAVQPGVPRQALWCFMCNSANGFVRRALGAPGRHPACV